ncbi:hypothetical protein L7F22_055294 [Adiantum nelumboides]|nr:hypothetical protein [Adiantum nelumboides]
MSSSSAKVLSAWRSPFGVRVLVALKEKGVEYEYEEQDMVNKSELLLACNPVHKKVPVLIHNGKPICESLIIVQYIDETWPSHDNKGFLPSDPLKRALVRFWTDYADKKVFEACGVIWKNKEEELREQGRNMIKECMATLDGALKDVFGGGPYFGGECINLVDITLSSFIPWFLAVETFGDFKILEENNCPHLCEWAKLVVQHPSVKEGLATAPSKKVLESAQETRKKYYGFSH